MYIIDQQRQQALIAEMTQLRKDNQSWEVYYHNPATNVMWKSFFPKATSASRGPKILRTEPVPHELEKRLDDCLVHDNADDAIGLAIELSVEPEKWEQIIDIAAHNYRRYNRKQLSLFLKELGVERFEELFEEIGFDLSKTTLTKETFKMLARRSRRLRFKRFFYINLHGLAANFFATILQ